MKTYLVTTPIAGHLSFEVEAESEEAAKEKVREMDASDGELTWDRLDRFHTGNVCHCPSPWEETVELIDDDES